MADIQKPGFAPRETFLEILKWMPIPTFDLVLDVEGSGVILLKRTIEPYKDVWALPGLRKLKGETLAEVLIRVARDEVGLTIEPNKGKIIGQYVRQFEEENHREDVSTGYVFRLPAGTEPKINEAHFSEWRFLKPDEPLPEIIGDMYQYYIDAYRVDK